MIQEVGKLLDDGCRKNICDVYDIQNVARDFPAKPTIFAVVTVNLEERDRINVVGAASMGRRSMLRVTHL